MLNVSSCSLLLPGTQGTCAAHFQGQFCFRRLSHLLHTIFHKPQYITTYSPCQRELQMPKLVVMSEVLNPTFCQTFPQSLLIFPLESLALSPICSLVETHLNSPTPPPALQWGGIIAYWELSFHFFSYRSRVPLSFLTPLCLLQPLPGCASYGTKSFPSSLAFKFYRSFPIHCCSCWVSARMPSIASLYISAGLGFFVTMAGKSTFSFCSR